MTEQRHRVQGRAAWPPAAELVRYVVGPAAGLVALLLFVALVVSPGAFTVRVPEPVVAAPTAEASDPLVDPAPQAAPPRPDPVPAPASPGPADGSDDRLGDDAVDALTALLQQRDRAVLEQDAVSWLRASGPDPESALAFTVLAGLPVTDFESSLVPDSLRPAEEGAAEDGAAEGGAAQGGTPDGMFDARVETTYELADGPAVIRSDTVRIAPDAAGDGLESSEASGWQVVGWEPFPAQGELGTAAPWDLGTVRPTVGERAVVLSWAVPDDAGAASPEAVAAADGWGRQVATWADRGAVTVDSYLGTGWPRTTLVLVPASDAQYDALVPGPRSETNGVFAAVTTDVDTPDGGGDVVVVNPAARAELVDETWQVTITHELVHVASGARYGDTQEIWLAEGLADLIGWSPLVPATVSRERVAARLLQRVADGEADVSTLPDNGRFSDADADVVGDAYEGSWLAALLLQDELGTEGMLALYADASEGPGSSRQRTDGALRSATGEGRAAFEERWRGYLSGLAER